VSPEWRRTQLTFGSAEGRFHAHSYYDIPVIDAEGRRIAVHRTRFVERQPGPGDAVEIGLVDADAPGSWEAVAESDAWSWQQGPLAQWIGGGPRLAWGDREDGRFVGRLLDVRTGERRTLPAPVYAADADGRFALSLNMARIDAFRPGYGFPCGTGANAEAAAPAEDGVWRIDLATGEARLILSLAAAVEALRRLAPLAVAMRAGFWRGVRFWFNHVKISPDGTRFTVKLRWRRPGGPWNDRKGVSLTANASDGGAVRLLADATSHVIWSDSAHLYLWRKDGLALYADSAPRGRRIAPLLPGVVTANVHIRHLPPEPTAEPRRFVLDTPYRESVSVLVAEDGSAAEIARFDNHRPAKGPFRCDLHPVPSADGRRIVVTSMHDGGRQVYLLTRAGA